MTLGNASDNASIAVSDMARATAFYEDKLALSPETEQPDGSRIYACAGDTKLHVYPSPDSAGRTAGTVAGIQVIPDGKVAWFRDPDGNTFAIEQQQ